MRQIFLLLIGLTSLRWLYLYENQISDLTPLQGLTSLTELRLHKNQISDLTPLQGLTSLRELWLLSNQISDFTPLQGLTSLTDLRLHENQISDLTPLQGLTSLSWLYLGANQISDLTPLQGLTGLTTLDLSQNQISDLTPLQEITSLKWLFLANNQISNLMPLQGLTSLERLALIDNYISDLSPLLGLPDLSYLDVSVNPLSCTAITVQIPQLEGNGVFVYFNDACTPEEGEPPAVFHVVAVEGASFQREVGDTVSFEVEARNAVGALSYQWYKLTEDKGMAPVGTNSPIYTILPITKNDFGAYQCNVHDADLDEDALSPVFTLALAPHMPVAALFGLTMTAALTALSGAAALRRKR